MAAMAAYRIVSLMMDGSSGKADRQGFCVTIIFGSADGSAGKGGKRLIKEERRKKIGSRCVCRFRFFYSYLFSPLIM